MHKNYIVSKVSKIWTMSCDNSEKAKFHWDQLLVTFQVANVTRKLMTSRGSYEQLVPVEFGLFGVIAAHCSNFGHFWHYVVFMHLPPNNLQRRQFVFRYSVRPSVHFPSLFIYFTCRDFCSHGGRISVKLVINIHHVSGHCWN